MSNETPDKLHPEIPFTWYESFFIDRVLAKVVKDMGDCEGFFEWLAECAPELYTKIKAAERDIDSLWLSHASKESFNTACLTWYKLLMEARTGFDQWKASKAEEQAKAGMQEAFPLR